MWIVVDGRDAQITNDAPQHCSLAAVCRDARAWRRGAWGLVGPIWWAPGHASSSMGSHADHDPYHMCSYVNPIDDDARKHVTALSYG